MSLNINTRTALVLGMGALVCSVDSLQAQTSPSFLRMQAAQEIQKGKWEEAIALINKAIDVYTPRIKMLGIKDDFGWFHFQKGQYEFINKRYDSAIVQFQTCYEKFPDGKLNVLRNMALMRWAECAIQQGEYKRGRELLEKFLRERNPNVDRVNIGIIYALMSQCCFLEEQPNFDEGIKNLNLVVQNRANGQIPDANIFRAFLAMLQSAINTNRPEVAVKFLRENRKAVLIDEWRMGAYNSTLSQFALQAFNKNMPELAYEITSVIPSNSEVLENIKFALNRIGELPGVLDSSSVLVKEGLKKLEQDYSQFKGGDGDPERTKVLLGAFINLNEGNYRSAREGMKILAAKYPELATDTRETVMFQLVNVSSLLGDIMEAEKHAQAFLKEFPKSTYVPTVHQMTLMSLIKDGKFDKAYEVSTKVLQSSTEKTEQHEMASYVKGISAFSLGKVKEALGILGKFSDMYPKSQFSATVDYTIGQGYYFTEEMDKAKTQFGKFIEKYKEPADAGLLPWVYYMRSLAYFTQNDEEGFKLSMADLEHLEKTYASHEIIAQTLLAKANVYRQDKKIEEAEKYYVKALEEAKRLKKNDVQAEALFKLGELYSDESKPRVDDFVKVYDEYFQNHDRMDRPFRIELAAISIDTMDKAGRWDQAMDRLQKLLIEYSRNPEKSGSVEPALVTYTKAYVKKNDAEKVKQHFNNFPGVRHDDVELRAMLRIGVIGVYEDVLKKAGEDVALKGKSEAAIKVLFDELRNDFKPKDLSPYILIKLGNYLRDNPRTAKEAIPYYEEVVARKDAQNLMQANFGLADIYVGSSDRNLHEKAVAMLKDIIDKELGKDKIGKIPDRQTLDKARLRVLRAYSKLGKWAEATTAGEEYMTQVKVNRDRPEATFLYAVALKNNNNLDQSIIQQNLLISNYRGLITWSAPAMCEYLDMLVKRGKPEGYTAPGGKTQERSDKYLAWERARGYLNATRPNLDKMTTEDKELWRKVEQMFNTLEADPNLAAERKKVEEIKRNTIK